MALQGSGSLSIRLLQFIARTSRVSVFSGIWCVIVLWDCRGKSRIKCV